MTELEMKYLERLPFSFGDLPAGKLVDAVGAVEMPAFRRVPSEKISFSDLQSYDDGVTYLRVLDEKWWFFATIRLGVSPLLADLYAFLDEYPQAVRRVALVTCDLVEFGEGADMTYRFVDVVDDQPRLLLVLYNLYCNAPEDELLALTVGPLDQRGYSSMPDSVESVDCVLSDFEPDRFPDNDMSFVAEVKDFFRCNSLEWPKEVCTREEATDLLWSIDSVAASGKCAYACFRPSCRAALTSIVGTAPTVAKFVAIVLVARRLAWLVDTNWVITVSPSKCHLQRESVGSSGSPVSIADVGPVGHGDRYCGNMGYHNDICGACSVKPSVGWRADLVMCQCCVREPSMRVSQSIRGLLHARADGSGQQPTAIRVTHAGQSYDPGIVSVCGSHGGLEHYKFCELPSGQAGPLPVCSNVPSVVDYPGVLSYVGLRGSHIEIVLPAGIGVVLAGGISFRTDRRTSIVAQSHLLLFFTTVVRDQFVMGRSRSYIEWLRWHHMSAKLDPSQSSARFFERTACSVVVCSGASFGATGEYESTVHGQDVDAGWTYTAYGRAGSHAVGGHGSVVGSVFEDMRVGKYVVPKGRYFGVAPRFVRFGVRPIGSSPFHHDPAYGVMAAWDEYALDDGGPSDDGFDGEPMFGDAY